jgi:hypothetical protein
MKPELKKRWVDALRSGKYQQTDSALEDANGHCCLGVACSLFADEMGLSISEYGPNQEYSKFDGRHDYLPDRAQKFLELTETGILPKTVADPKTGYIYASLASLNDDANYTFRQIADVIDEQF